MGIGVLPLIQTTSAAEAAGSAKLSDEARELLQPELPVKDYLASLVQREYFKDAYSLLAVALPQREAVWWACLCIRQSHGALRSNADDAALRAAVEWVLEPTPELRQRARDIARPAGTDCGCAASAAGAMPVPLATDSHSAASPTRLIRRAILLASVHGDPRVLAPYPEHFVKLGLSVASGTHRWKKTGGGGKGST
jgi:hypothetical protein